ncbi:MAG TPA: RNA-binding S4 domain-containing protein [Bacillota bacterium]|nr:RNA-binding S4 domain-containing protein [Bacillota bacterium]
MRLDKYLKVSRIIKRRTVANEACSGGRVQINDKVGKPGTTLKVGDIITIQFGNQQRKYEVLELAETTQKSKAASLYREI